MAERNPKICRFLQAAAERRTLDIDDDETLGLRACHANEPTPLGNRTAPGKVRLHRRTEPDRSPKSLFAVSSANQRGPRASSVSSHATDRRAVVFRELHGCADKRAPCALHDQTTRALPSGCEGRALPRGQIAVSAPDFFIHARDRLQDFAKARQ
jgi:hypothetical protein